MAHGEIFTIATDRGEPQRVSEASWKEQDPRWSPQRKCGSRSSAIAPAREELYLSDRARQNGEEDQRRRLRQGGIVWAGDSKTLMWSGERP